jgi:hypothetical protein
MVIENGFQKGCQVKINLFIPASTAASELLNYVSRCATAVYR